MSDDAAAAPEEAKPEAPVKKRKKKKRRAEGDAELGRRGGRPSNWPIFADNFPSDDKLNELVLAFERGDYALVREGGRRILDERPARPNDVRSATRELLRRIDPDPIAVYLLAGAALLLVFLSLWYWTHTGSAP